jgi:hypothetical protein
MNAVLRSLVTSTGKILYLSLAYQMVKNTAEYLRETFGAQLVEVPIDFPTSDDLIVQVPRDYVQQLHSFTVCICISCNPP